MTDKIFVQYGCGLSTAPSWMNFDVSPRLRIERLPAVGRLFDMMGKKLYPDEVIYGDIVSGLPIADRSADAVFCSHVLEHIDRRGVESALRNSFRILKSGGIFRLIVPDLKWRAERLLEDIAANDTHAADRFMQSSCLGEETRAQGVSGLARAALGNSQHRWMYDKATMIRLLNEAGFVEIRECAMGDSGEPAFDEVEQHDRFYDEGHKELALQAIRPYADVDKSQSVSPNRK